MSIFIYLATIFWSLFPNLIHVFQGGNDFINKVNATNLVSNGDFSGGTIGWVSSSSTSVVVNNNLINTANGTDKSPYITYTGSLVVNDDYYINIKNRVLSGDCLVLQYKLDNYIVYKNINSPIQNQWYINSNIIKATNTRMGARFHHIYLDNAIANGKQMEVEHVYLYNVSTMITKGIKNDDGILFSELTDEQIMTQLDTWISEYGDLSFTITKDNTSDAWFNTGFVDKTAERDFLDYLGYFVWLMTPPIMLFITLDLIRRLI